MTTNTAQIGTQEMQWGMTPDISEVKAFDNEDYACFRDLRDVLKKHNALERFGITLIHRHFDIADDEMLVEFTDIEKRELLIKPVKKIKASKMDSMVTNWKLYEGDQIATVICTCARTHQGHTGGHGSV